jgi:hypothetical protein
MCWALNRIYEDRNARRGVVCKLIREMELPNGKTMWKLLTREGRKAVVVAEKMVAGKTVANVREVEIAALGACVDSLEDKYGARCAARWLVGVYPDWATDYIFCAYRFNSANPYDDDKNNAAVCEAVRKVLGNPFIKRKKKAVT